MHGWGYWDGMSGWGYAVMAVSTILFWALVIVAIVALVRYMTRLDRAEPRMSQHQQSPPERLLAERYARGEINSEEYRERLAVLRTESSPP